jgi:hypothetical protein
VSEKPTFTKIDREGGKEYRSIEEEEREYQKAVALACVKLGDIIKVLMKDLDWSENEVIKEVRNVIHVIQK